MTTPTEPDDSSRLERALGWAWSDDQPWELLTALTQLENRMGGSPGERAAADLVAEAFERVGVANVGLESFPIQYWERGETTFVVTDPVEREFEALALPYAPAADLEAPLVDVGYGTPEEIDAAGKAVEGAIVVASTTTPAGQRFVHRMEKFGHAVDAGAAGFVFANHVPGQLPPTGSLRFDREAAIPGIGVSAETHDWLTEYANSPTSGADESANARANLRVEATTTDGSSQNVVGTLGPDTDDELLMLAHYDAHDVAEGALDNGCGVATILGAASILADVESDLGCRVRVAAVGCEEIGLLGAEALAERLDLESIRAVVNVDGAGRFRNPQAYSHASEEMRALATEVGERYGQPVVHETDPHPFSDHWPFLRAGVPALQLHSEPAGGGERGRGWGHTAADTRDKVDVRNIRTHAMLAALLVRTLSRRTPSRIDATDLREAFREQHYEPGMRASDTWPRAWD
ncbi:M28 family metallopeptidase [Natronosalvus caseinilyticus]|uniref:M28 family metallopeptidase n=1 Tax=Natronosalvus caseinilyticus TaxID=2953747 RepID=UPI0028A8F80C|nr:M28 family metallopeptidase [Natronosalvus caseinilyticus]